MYVLDLYVFNYCSTAETVIFTHYFQVKLHNIDDSHTDIYIIYLLFKHKHNNEHVY